MTDRSPDVSLAVSCARVFSIAQQTGGELSLCGDGVV